MRKINIAIDGPSAAGKSSIAIALCEKLGYIHLDTGSMYRAVGLYAKENNINPKDEETLKEKLKDIKIDFDSLGHIYLNDEDVSDKIRTNEISLYASDVGTLLSVRQDMVARQKEFAINKGVIMDGRDIGTVVLKDAELKIFLTASSETRAQRRYLQNKENGIESNFEDLVKEIEERDYQDTHRENSPLVQAEDAILVDTSDMTISEAVDEIYKLYLERI